MRRTPPFLAIAFVLLACSSGGGGNPPPPSTAPTVSASAASPATINPGSSSTSILTVGGNPAPTVSCAIMAGGQGACSVSGSIVTYTAPASVSNPMSVTVRITAQNSAGTATADMTVNVNANPATPPTLSFNQTTFSVGLGAGGSVTATMTGIPAPTLSCGNPSPARGSVSVAGNTVNYNAPSDQPLGSVVFSCTAQNSAGSDTKQLTVNLTNPPPTVSHSGAPLRFFAPFGVNVRLTLDVFDVFPGVTEFRSSFGTMGPWTDPQPGKVQVNFSVPVKYDWLEIWAVNPGPGGGESSRIVITVKPNLPSGVCNNSECVQTDVSTGNYAVYDPNTEQKLREFVGAATRGLARDDQTNLLVQTGTNAVIAIFNGTGGVINGTGNGKLNMGAAGRSGWGCVAQYQDDQIAAFDLNVSNPPMPFLPVGDMPWLVEMYETAGQKVCTGFNVEEMTIFGVRIPQMTEIFNRPALPGFSKFSIFSPALRGGWKTAIFRSGTFAGTLAVLDEDSRRLAFVNIQTGAISGNIIILPDAPILLAADAANGFLYVAVDDQINRRTLVDKVDLATRQVTRLSINFPFLANYLAMCGQNLSSLCSGNGDNKFARRTPN